MKWILTRLWSAIGAGLFWLCVLLGAVDDGFGDGAVKK